VHVGHLFSLNDFGVDILGERRVWNETSGAFENVQLNKHQTLQQCTESIRDGQIFSFYWIPDSNIQYLVICWTAEFLPML